jgi:hypothetical protein
MSKLENRNKSEGPMEKSSKLVAAVSDHLLGQDAGVRALKLECQISKTNQNHPRRKSETLDHSYFSFSVIVSRQGRDFIPALGQRPTYSEQPEAASAESAIHSGAFRPIIGCNIAIAQSNRAFRYWLSLLKIAQRFNAGLPW